MPPRRVHLRTLLALVLVTTLVSFGVFAASLAWNSWERHLEVVEQQNVEFVTAISVAIDQEIERSTTALEVLAALDILDTPDLIEFQEVARRMVPRQPGWHSVVVAGANGEMLLNTAAHVPQAPTRLSTAWARAVIESGREQVSNLVQDPGVPGHFFIVAVPVVRGGAVTHVLGAKVRREILTEVLHRYEIPPDGVVALLDRDRRMLARTRKEADYVGEFPSPDFFEAAGRMEQGTWRSTLLENVPAYAALKRSPSSGWTVGLGIPEELLTAGLRRSLWSLVAAGVLVLVAGGWSVLLLTRGVVPALDTAAGAARALARDERLPTLSSRISEVARLFDGLQDAEATLAARRRERDEAARSRDVAAQEREHALLAERAAREEAENANRLKDEFLMAVSHELRTPLTAIRGWARMLTTGDIHDAQRGRAIETIDRNAHALTQLVNDLLDVSQGEAGKLRLDLRVVAVAEVVRAAADAVQPAALARGISVGVSTAVDDALVLGDPDRLQQVVWNVVANAVKFTPSGGRVDLSVAQRDEHAVEVAVSDNGPGIDPEFLPYVFDRFRQGSAGRLRAHGGLGLGLAIVRHLTEMHGGTVSAENNRVGPGATFRIILPVPSESPLSPHGPPLAAQL
jgi:signal transduction histidine kinase